MKRKKIATAALTVADVNAQLPGSAKEIAAVLKFNIAWFRNALAAVNIAVEDLNNQGECKAALITYYQCLETAESEVEATKALRQEVEEVVVPSSHTLWARGALLKNAPLPNKTAGLNWKVNSTTDRGLMAGGLRSLMGQYVASLQVHDTPRFPHSAVVAV